MNERPAQDWSRRFRAGDFDLNVSSWSGRASVVDNGRLRQLGLTTTAQKMTSYMYSLVALFIIVRFSSQGVIGEHDYSRERRNFFMSSGPSRARVMEMERLVNSIFPRKTRGDGSADSVEDVRPVVIPAEALIEKNQPCFCPVFSPCVGKCQRTYRYW
ncbi:hypothetical protein Y032_0415g1070 [Ancylostoma ceylanicum]|uniref:Uncharacterized protein n=1 Tax=Ancylostoma ceylanicum TaxID=53326 RepID=A0A016X196_9BILA|nr:hypothetical protein Y032_0415g1070 [Ancylostoma ceylanicum]